MALARWETESLMLPGDVPTLDDGSALFWPLAEPLEVHDTRGCHRPVDGFVIICLGVCVSCQGRDR